MALINLLPPNIQGNPNMKALGAALDAGIQALPGYDDFYLYNIANIEPAFLPWPARQFHVDDFDQAGTEAEQRSLIKQAIALHRYKGTP